MNVSELAEVREIPTTAGSMWSGHCTEHGEVVIPVFELQGVGRWLGIHLGRMHGLAEAWIPIRYADGSVTR